MERQREGGGGRARVIQREREGGRASEREREGGREGERQRQRDTERTRTLYLTRIVV